MTGEGRAGHIFFCRGLAWPAVAWRGLAWPGVAWRGVAWRGREREDGRAQTCAYSSLSVVGVSRGIGFGSHGMGSNFSVDNWAECQANRGRVMVRRPWTTRSAIDAGVSRAMISSEACECQRLPGSMFVDASACRSFQMDSAPIRSVTLAYLLQLPRAV